MEEKKIGYNIFKFILGSIFWLYYHPKFVNTKVIPKEGPIIICGNHKHLMDQCLPILSTKRMLHYMAKKEYFDSKFAWFFKMSGCIRVNRQDKDEAHVAMDEAAELLKKGYAIGIFPEGTRNKTDQLLLPFKFGAVKMAKETNASIVPFGITGKYKFWNNKLKVTFGKPFKVGNMTLEEANKKLYDEIANIIK